MAGRIDPIRRGTECQETIKMHLPEYNPTDTRIGKIENEDQFNPNDWLGELIDSKYQIGTNPEVDILGEGTFGTVYRASEQGVDRVVAIKRIRLFKSSIEKILEANIQSDARSNYTIPIYSSGKHNKESWVAMELGGKTFNAFAQEESPDLSERVRLIKQICQGVDILHSQGIVHGDLKPSNILISPPKGNEKPTPKIIDFGISSSVSRNHTDEQGLGTPPYRSKSQSRGFKATKECDLHAIGVLLEQQIMPGLSEDRYLTYYPTTERRDLFLEWISINAKSPNQPVCGSAHSIQIFLSAWESIRKFNEKAGEKLPRPFNRKYASWFYEQICEPDFIAPGYRVSDKSVFGSIESKKLLDEIPMIQNFEKRIFRDWKGTEREMKSRIVLLCTIYAILRRF